jgi:SAM-dependent methyltransferase
MESYDAFAPYFDAWQRAFGGVYDDLILGRVVAALREHAPGARKVVDLGIGTGDMVIALARGGYRVVGVDRSEPMLAVAREKAAAASLAEPPEFLRQDLRDLVLDAPVDAAVCVYTVVNQLVADGDLLRALLAVHATLVAGGVFVFEVNLPASYARYWSGTERVTAGDAVITREHRQDPGATVIEARVTIRRGAEVVHDTIAQRPYSDAELDAALHSTGFARVACEAFNPFDADAEPIKALWVARRD